MVVVRDCCFAIWALAESQVRDFCAFNMLQRYLKIYLGTKFIIFCNSLTVGALHSYIPYSFGSAAWFALNLFRVLSKSSESQGDKNSNLGRIDSWSSRSDHGQHDSLLHSKDLVEYVSNIALLLCFSIFADTTAAHSFRGCERQRTLILGRIPMALVLGLVLHLNGEGLWSGLMSGGVMQCILLTLVTCLTNWENQVLNSAHKFVIVLKPRYPIN
ncbi:hypothetical protein OSB04_004371 [Centaurea solstitialis]|uniref:Uncharacterized protein n=1 Tax=Centaurea solstitialis TaxID=347529 RepID=A0AA38U8B4_9ASTR|nr:hypothetical protein OSB04_004371 [Centaurea solstitialis]